MSSFNVIDGIPATGNKWLLTDLLRNQWGFKGFVVSDYTSVNEMTAHGMGDLQTVSALSLKAGLDMDMVGEGFLSTLQKSLLEKKITQQEIDAACRRVLEAKYKLGLFDDPYRGISEARGAAEILTAENRMAARDIAARSFVLLKNDKQLLPLKKAGTIAVIGPLADSKRNMLGTWSVSGDWQKSVSVIEGIKNVVGNKATLMYAKGASISDDTGFIKRVNALGVEIDPETRSVEAMIQEAVDIAKESDIIVAVVGEAADMTGEASSRASIDIPESQQLLLKALVKTGKRVVMVLFNGRPMTLNWESKNIPAILDVWSGGTEAGNAIADVLFGNHNPSGKLTTSFPYSVGQIPVYYNHLNTGRPFNIKAGDWPKFKSDYLDIPNEPLYPFGYGLSYTSFGYGNLELDKTSIKSNEQLAVKTTVTNTGNYDGEETVQLYIQDMVGSIARPVKELKGFQKIFLKKGESRQVVFNVTVDDLKFYNKDLKWGFEPGAFKVFIGTNSENTKEASFSLTDDK